MKNIKILFVILISLILIVPNQLRSQENDILNYLKNFKIKGAVDAYYAWDTDKDKTQRQFVSFEPFRDQIKLNIAQVSLSYNSENVRGKVTLHYGDIPQVNWPSNMQNIQESNIGFSPFKNLWIDAGYFMTFVGGEGMPMNSMFSSFSTGSYYEPFYESGLKISYDFSEKFSSCLHIINGYNVLEDNNKNKSVGLELTYKPISKISFDYNVIIGNEMPTDLNNSKLRVYNDLYINYAPTEKLEFIFGVDFASQEKSNITDSTASAFLFSTFLSGRYKITPKFFFSVRAEYFSDADGFLSGTFTGNDGNLSGLKSWGVTGALEYRPVEFYYVRLESRYLSANSKLKIFYDNSNSRTEATINMGFEF
jgi:hypothetical protein